MRAQIIIDTLKALYAIRRPVCIEGPPGGGKTSLANQTAEELGIELIHIHVPTKLVEDFGILFPKEGTDQLAYRLDKWWPTEGNGILLFDDRNQCSPDLQKVLANIIQARELHGRKLPDGWSIVSTGNRQSDRAGANRVLTHLKDRETTLELETDLDGWCRWAYANDIKPEVISFLRFRPGLLHNFDPQQLHSPTPRGWEAVSTMLGVAPVEAEYDCLKGTVGEGAAAEMVGFLKIVRKLPNPDAIMLDPATGEVPTDPATLYALTGALAHRATKDNLHRVITYFDRLPPEFGVLGVSSIIRRDATLASTKAFTEWSISHQDVIG